MRIIGFALLLPAVAKGTEAVMGEMGNDISGRFEEGGDELAYYGPLVKHKFGCVDEGKWEGSCDVSLEDPATGERPVIYAAGDFSTTCDPLKAEQQLGTLQYVEEEGWVDIETEELVVGWSHPNTPNWTCPVEERNPSGCGDFRTDTRNIQCSDFSSLFDCGRPNNADDRVMRVSEYPTLDIPQRHACVQHPIFYDNVNDVVGEVVPPALGRHRERWAKWGEYDYLPTQRWMHNAEHGGAIFLYNQCLDEESKCALRRLIQKWQARIGIVEWEGDSQIDEFVEAAQDNEDKFRFIMTPFKDLWTPISIVLWGNVYSSKCFNEVEIDEFIASNYRRAYEDWPPDGAYRYLWTNITENAEDCPALPQASPSTIVNALDESYATAEAMRILAAQVEDLKEEVTNLRAAASQASNLGSLRRSWIAVCFAALLSATAMFA